MTYEECIYANPLGKKKYCRNNAVCGWAPVAVIVTPATCRSCKHYKERKEKK